MKKIIILIIFISIGFFVRNIYAQQRVGDAHDFGPVTIDDPLDKIVDSDYSGVGEKEDFIGIWEINRSQRIFKASLKAPDMIRTWAEFHENGMLRFSGNDKSGRIEEEILEYEISGGFLLIIGDESEEKYKFGFIDDGEKLIIKSENATMLLIRENK